MKVFNSVLELVGNTPLLKLNKIDTGKANVYCKIESFNPAGSVKDRVGINMIEQAEKRGDLKPGATIIEPTSGNTGIGLAMSAAVKGYKMILVMPENMSMERIKLAKAYGAEVVLTPAEKGMAGTIEKSAELKETIPGAFIPGQFDNMDNAQAHYMTTGPEIYEDLDGQVDCFVSAFGTGGTISGTGKYLKEKNPACKIVGVEPLDSPLVTKGLAGPHKLQGIGANFVPKILDLDIIDEIYLASTEDSYKWAQTIAKEEGVLVGISSGSALYTAMELAKKEEFQGKNIVVILADSGEKYLSTDLF
ncbi:MAG: cysteine synthase A [Clostridia bacterium]|nr:cysteine synthase A [Clostridia bacterium]